MLAVWTRDNETPLDTTRDIIQELVDGTLLDNPNEVFHSLGTSLTDDQLNTMRQSAMERSNGGG
jgi:hypothetical protein